MKIKKDRIRQLIREFIIRIINENSNNEIKTLYVFDFDDCLVDSSSRIALVIKQKGKNPKLPNKFSTTPGWYWIRTREYNSLRENHPEMFNESNPIIFNDPKDSERNNMLKTYFPNANFPTGSQIRLSAKYNGMFGSKDKRKYNEGSGSPVFNGMESFVIETKPIDITIKEYIDSFNDQFGMTVVITSRSSLKGAQEISIIKTLSDFTGIVNNNVYAVAEGGIGNPKVRKINDIINNNSTIEKIVVFEDKQSNIDAIQNYAKQKGLQFESHLVVGVDPATKSTQHNPLGDVEYFFN